MPVPTLALPATRLGALGVAAAFLAALSSCRGDQRETPIGYDASRTGDTIGRTSGTPEYLEIRRVLYRRTSTDTLPLLALDSGSAPRGVPALPVNWSPIPEAEFGVYGDRFRHIVPSPEDRWVAWEPFSTHELVGVIPTRGGAPVVLDFYWDSGADSLVWAPGDRYLASYYPSPSGFDELRLYDAERGIRLMPPWEDKCSSQTECAVRAARWTGPTTILVRTTVDDREGREYRVDVSTLPVWIPPGERPQAPADRR